MLGFISFSTLGIFVFAVCVSIGGFLSIRSMLDKIEVHARRIEAEGDDQP